MVKRICALSAALSCLVGMVGCSDGDSEGTYVNIWSVLYDASESAIYPNFEVAAGAFLEKNDSPILASPLYLNDGDCITYMGEFGGNFWRYTGSYQMDGDRLVISYDSAAHCTYRDDELVVTDMTEGEGRIAKNVNDQIDTANETKSVISSSVCISRNDRRPYFKAGAIKVGGEDEYASAGPMGDVTVALYKKGDFLVAKEYNYSLDVKKAGKTFTLNYESVFDSGITCTYTFEDGTWTDESSQTSGEFIVKNDNLVIALPPKDDDYGISNVSIFYLDFDAEEVYIPVYAKSTVMNGQVEELNDDPAFK